MVLALHECGTLISPLRALYKSNHLRTSSQNTNQASPGFSPLQPSRPTRASGWSSPTWCCSSASRSGTTSSPTTSTCARSSPAATWPLTPTCPAPAPPATTPATSRSARSRTLASASRWRHVLWGCVGWWWWGGGGTGVDGMSQPCVVQRTDVASV